MSPENKQPSSLDAMRSLGEQQLKAAHEFQSKEPQFVSNMPDIRMQLGSKNEGESENNHELGDEAESLKYARRESLSDELINAAETPEELFIGLRLLERQLEDGHTPPSLSERYTPPRQHSAMFERKEAMSVSIEDLKKRGWLKNYNPDTGEGRPKDARFASFAISSEQTENIIEENSRRYLKNERRYNFGTPESRKVLALAYERAIHELEVRDILGEHVSLRINLDYRDNLEGLVEMLHSGRMPKLKAKHLEVLFNMPSLEELSKPGLKPEELEKMHGLGDQVEEAVFLNLLMLNSGTRQGMKDFLDKPGAAVLMNRLAEKAHMNIDEWKVKYVGVLDEWVDDDKREIESYKKEPRGLITMFSNIPAIGTPGEFGSDKESDFIEKYVGGAVGSVEASWIAATLMRSTGAYASEGYVALPNGKSSLPLGEGRYISGDDTGKFHTYMFNYKEGMKGRPSGLKDMVGRIPDMAMNLFDWAQVRVDDLPLEKGEPVRRSIWDAWLGTPGGKRKTILLTGKESNDPKDITTEEGYHRLGDMKFDSLDREFHGTFTIMQWLMGREGAGVFTDAIKTDFRMEDFSLNELKKKVKYMGIVMNPVVMTKGSTQNFKYENDDPGHTAFLLQRNFFKNLMSARVKSASFALNILPSQVRLYNPGFGQPKEISVPAALLVHKFIDEAIKFGKSEFSNEADIVKHYIDDNYNLRTSGTMLDVEKILKEAVFEDKVGLVIGRKK